MAKVDVIVIGAGAAGLTAARELARSGKTVAVLEARDRTGGRILTLRDAACSAPIELGAEFIHGSAELTFQLLREIGESAVGEGGTFWQYRNGTLVQPDGDPFEEFPKLLAGVDRSAPDQSIDDFLQRIAANGGNAQTAAWVRLLVEGFDAADPAVASAQAIAEEWAGSAGLERSQHRPACGYAPLIDGLAASLPPSAPVFLQTVVEKIEWGRGKVQVTAVRFGQRLRFESERAIVTIPIALLARDSIEFAPALPAAHRRAMDGIVMGPVTKVALQFRSPFWADVKESLADASFFSGGETAFPTFWTTYPRVSPIVVAWAGGPRCASLPAGRDAIIARVLGDFATVIGVDERTALDRLQAAHFHDWTRDPYALGAYSYLRTGAMGAREALAVPIEQTLYFAGEALALHGLAGTVEGALRSGIAAASAAMAH